MTQTALRSDNSSVFSPSNLSSYSSKPSTVYFPLFFVCLFSQKLAGKMEAQAVRRRINMISAHFVPTDELSATHVLPMNCSSTLNSVIRRCDNKLYFARQGSAHQATFMRQGSNEDVLETGNTDCNIILNSATTPRRDSKMYFARQGSAHQACFMRQACNEEVLPAESHTPLDYPGYGIEFSYYVSQEGPLFSRPSSTEQNFSTAGAIQPAFQGCELSAADPPKFAVPSYRGLKGTNLTPFFFNAVIEWSPRMDVAESGCTYVITVEIPSVSVRDIRVEIDDKKLIVACKRCTQYLKVACSANDSISAYFRRETVQGPYEVVWSLPANVNKDCILAKFLDGVLRVVIPKLREALVAEAILNSERLIAGAMFNHREQVSPGLYYKLDKRDVVLQLYNPGPSIHGESCLVDLSYESMSASV